MTNLDVFPIPGFHEPLSSFSHLLAAPFFAVLGVVLVRRGDGHAGRIASLTIMAVSTVFLLTMSGVYHLLGPGYGRFVMKQLDVAGVFTLIAGTVTPVHAILFKGFHRWAPLLLVWLVAIVGIALRTIFADSLPLSVGTCIFLLMGWGGAISAFTLWRQYGFQFVSPLLWGGLAYSIGALIIIFHQPVLVPGIVGPHELWHVAVLVGLGMHWSFVFSFASGPPQARSLKGGLCPL